MFEKILIATHNKGKFIEIKEIFGDDFPTQLVSLDDLNITQDIEETGRTFANNAKLKARSFAKLAHLPTIADDSGIEVDALKNELGVQTRRWGAGPKASDKEWISYFLDRLKNERIRRARFICNVALCVSEEIKVFEGITEGVITNKLMADYLPGLPISACFMPNGYNKVYSELSIREKNKISHRGKAFHKLKTFILNNYVTYPN